MNTVFNATETQEASFVVNGRDGSSWLKIVGVKCQDCD